MGDKELRVSVSELSRLSIGCNACKSEIVFSAEAARGPGETHCPNCGASMPNVGTIVSAYRGFFGQIGTCTAPIYFLVRVED